MRLSDWLLLALLPALAAAQDGSVGAPVLGFAFDRAMGAIRPMRGIPGAALVDDPLDLGFPIASAAISPGRDFVLAVSSADSQLHLVRLDSGAPMEAALPDATIPGRVVFSPLGRSALLYQEAGPSRILTGLPGHPEARDLDLTFLSEAPAALAIADDGALVAASAGRNPADPLWLWAAGAGSLQLPLSAAAAAAFRPDSHDLAVITATGDVELVRNPGPDAGYRVISSAVVEPGSAPVVRLARDGARAYAADERGRLTVIDFVSGTSRSIDCGCRPETMEPLALKNVFQVTSLSSSPVMLFDASRPEARVWFVPVRQERSAQ